MIQTTNTLLLNCEQNARGLGGVYGPNLSKQHTGEHARVGGSIICYATPYYRKPLFYILFHNVVEGVSRTSSCVLTQSERRSSSEQNQKLRLKSKNHIQAECVRDSTQVTFIADLISLKKKKQ